MGNQQGRERRDHGRKIDWSTAEPPSSPGKPYLVPATNEKYMDVITIQWPPPLSDGGAPIIGYIVEHKRTGSPHWLRATAHLVRDTKLPLTGLEPGWRYQFRVSAENEVGRSNPGDLSEPLTVTPQKWAASVPFFNIELQDKIGLENEKVEFSVHVTGIPPPTICWYKNGFEIFSSRRTKIVTEDDRSTFIIHQAALEDEGEIKCTATNRAGHAITRANLKLEAPPRIRLPRQYEDGLIFENGEPILLKVTAVGRPKPLVSWYHNGEILRKSERIDIMDSKTGSLLKINEARRSDRGEYEIVGVNKIGEDVVSVLVTVTDRPSRPGNIHVAILGRKVTLTWSSPDDDGGCEIGTYIIEYFRVGWDVWLKATNSRQLTVTLENLIEGSQYKFRVRAENPYGISDPSEESEVTFVPDPERGILQPKLTTESLQVLKEIKWHAPVDENESGDGMRRKLLEEKAKKLLDTPLSQLLPYENNNNEKRKAESSVESIWTDDGEPNIIPSVPRRKNKGKKRLNLNLSNPELQQNQRLTLGLTDKCSHETSPIHKSNAKTNIIPEILNGTRNELIASPSTEAKHGKPYFQEREIFSIESPLYPRETDDSIIHGSSELMLVIYPRDRSKSVELAQQRLEIEMNLKGEGIAPPISLSSPELSSTKIFQLPPVRNAVSSTELLYERTAARLYQDAIDEEAQRTVKRRYSLNRKSVERRVSLRNPLLEEELSFRDEKEFREEPNEEKEEEDQSISEETKIEKKTEKEKKNYSMIPKLNPHKERLSSIEKERLGLLNVRERSKNKLEKQDTVFFLDHQSDTITTSTTTTTTTTTTTSSFENDDLEEEEEKEEENGNSEYSQENEESDANESKEEDFDDGIHELKLKLKESKIPNAEICAKSKEMSPFAGQEHETYHPKSMIPTRSVLSKLEKVEKDEKEKNSLLLTKKKETEKTSRIPVSSAQEKTAKKTSRIFKKFGLRKVKKIPEVISENPDHLPPPKPILKNKTERKSPVETFKLNFKKSIEKFDVQEESEIEIVERKKKVRITEPEEENEAENLKKEKEKEEMENRKWAEENAMENQVLIYHYSDILKEFGGNKKTGGLFEERPISRGLKPESYVAEEKPKAEIEDGERVEQRETKPDDFLEEAKTLYNKVDMNEADTEKGEQKRSEMKTPAQNLDSRIRLPLEYATNLAMFILACWLYLFKKEIYAIPILFIMAYRQLKNTISQNFEKSEK